MDGGEDGGHVVGRGPAVLQDVQADPPVSVHVRVEHFAHKPAIKYTTFLRFTLRWYRAYNMSLKVTYFIECFAVYFGRVPDFALICADPDQGFWLNGDKKSHDFICNLSGFKSHNEKVLTM